VDPALEDELQQLRAVLESRFGDALVALVAFGSQVQGRARPESDLDLLIVVRGLPRRRMDRRRLMAPVLHQVSDGFAATASTILLTPEEACSVKPFYLGLLDGHRALVDRDQFMATILTRLQRRLVELGARRLIDDQGYEYWDLKPDYVLGEDIVL
jgi:predicted nucleotidyltransferase